MLKQVTPAAHHVLRRMIHLSMGITPYLYYWHGQQIAGFFSLSLNQFLLIILVAGLLFEVIRIKKGFLLISQRDYERGHPSALFWSIVGIVMTFYWVPRLGYQGAALGAPIVFSMVIGDPLLGELRRLGVQIWVAALLGYLAIFAVWGLCYWGLGTPGGLCPVMPFLIVLAEMMPLKWIDDNFAMLALPLALCWWFYA